MKCLSGIHFVLSTLRNQSLFSVLVFSCLLKWWVAALRLQVIRFSFSLNGGNDSSFHPLRVIFSFMKWASADLIRLNFLTVSGSKRGLCHQVWTHWTPLGWTSQLSYQLFSDQHIISGCDSSSISGMIKWKMKLCMYWRSSFLFCCSPVSIMLSFCCGASLRWLLMARFSLCFSLKYELELLMD